MRPEGLAAFETRQETRSGIYAYEQRSANLVPVALTTAFVRQVPASVSTASQSPSRRTARTSTGRRTGRS
jgi:hypothetical protein